MQRAAADNWTTHRLERRALLPSCVVWLACCWLGACQGSASGELTVGVSRDLVEGGKDPYFVHRSLGVWESLTTLDDHLVAQPELAESWTEAPDGLSWTFSLRPGVRFQDGSPLDAAAVKLNIDRYLRISPRPSPFFTLDKRLAYGDLEAVEAAMWFGTDADDAQRFIVGLVGWMLEGLDEPGRHRALDDLRASVDAHATHDGVVFGSAAWVIRAARP